MSEQSEIAQLAEEVRKLREAIEAATFQRELHRYPTQGPYLPPAIPFPMPYYTPEYRPGYWMPHLPVTC